MRQNQTGFPPVWHCTQNQVVPGYVKALSRQTSSHRVFQNGLKLCVSFLNVVWTSWMGYKLPEWSRIFKTYCAVGRLYSYTGVAVSDCTRFQIVLFAMRMHQNQTAFPPDWDCTQNQVVPGYVKALSHRISLNYVLQNGLKRCASFLNVIWTSWTGYKLPERSRIFKTLNLLKIFWQPSRSEN